MNKYSNGKIYKIISPQCECYYIGSTKSSLKTRFSTHRAQHKRHLKGKASYNTAHDILKYLDACIVEMEIYPCNSRTELELREGVIQREHIKNIVNKNIAGRTKKQYNEDNRERINTRQMIYDRANREIISVKQKERRKKKKLKN